MLCGEVDFSLRATGTAPTAATAATAATITAAAAAAVTLPFNKHRFTVPARIGDEMFGFTFKMAFNDTNLPGVEAAMPAAPGGQFIFRGFAPGHKDRVVAAYGPDFDVEKFIRGQMAVKLPL